MKLQMTPRFPAIVQAANGDKVVRANGAYTFGPAYDQLTALGSLTDLPNTVFRSYNLATGLYRSLTAQQLASAIGLPITSGVRSRLLADINFYVRPDGSDANTGLANTSGGAFRTIQKAIDTAFASLDWSGFNVYVNVAAGTFTDPVIVTGKAVGQYGGGTLMIIGDQTTPANCIVSTTAADAFTITKGAAVTIAGFKVQTAISGNCVKCLFKSRLTLGAMEYGACAGYHIQTAYQSFTETIASYKISGAAAAHFYTVLSSVLEVVGITITLTGTPSFSTAFLVGAVNSYSHLVSVTFSGSATGQRFYMYMNAVYSDGSTHGYDYLPGNADGVTFGGAVYNNDYEYVGWQSWSPTIATVSGTAATASGQYKTHGRDFEFSITAVVGSIGASPSIAIPMPTVNNSYNAAGIGSPSGNNAFRAMDITSADVLMTAFALESNPFIFLKPLAGASFATHAYVISGKMPLNAYP
jgi:hypothetical protein